jgi:hypothetical protein
MTNIRIDDQAAERLIARLLRDKLSPGDANKLAADIVTGLKAATSSPTRPGLRGWRMISEHIPFEQIDNIVQDMRYQGIKADVLMARALWSVVYSFGHPIPDDITD